MNKPVVGLIAGVILGFLDGASAWFYPEQVRGPMMPILMGSSIKGLLVGVLAGWFARKVNSLAKGIVFGAVVGLLLAWGVAAIPDPVHGQHYLEIMLPGFVTGGIIGFLTQRYGSRPLKETA